MTLPHLSPKAISTIQGRDVRALIHQAAQFETRELGSDWVATVASDMNAKFYSSSNTSLAAHETLDAHSGL